MSGGSVVGVRGGVGSVLARADDLQHAASLLARAATELATSLESALRLARLHVGELGHVMLDAAGARMLRETIDQTWAVSRALGMAGASYHDADLGLVRDVALLVTPLPVSFGDLRVGWFYRALTGSVDQLLDDGVPAVTALGIDRDPTASTPPRTATDLIAQLAHRDRGAPGEIDVRIVDESAPGPRRVIVDLPGTTSLSPTGGGHEITDMITNARALRGLPTSYGEGTLEAMRQAGVRPGDQVLLVGHSQGGMVASQLAQQLNVTEEFSVTDVLTVGSPLAMAAAGTYALLAGAKRPTHTLALENEADPVPRLDRAPNRATPDCVTVTVRTAASGWAAHSLQDGYLPAMEALQTSADPSINDEMARLARYLDGSTVTTRTFAISRR